jgi:hypothetical protein
LERLQQKPTFDPDRGALLTLHPSLRRVIALLALLFLAFMAWTGITGGVTQWPESATVGQKAQTVTQLLYGLFALMSTITVVRARRWRSVSRIGWAGSVTIAAGLAAVVWGGTSPMTGIPTGAASLLIALVVLWALRVGFRDA